jgi:hypothetical protein
MAEQQPSITSILAALGMSFNSIYFWCSLTPR